MVKKDDNVQSLTLELLKALRGDIRALEEKMDARFDKVDARFEQVDARFEQVDTRLERVDMRLDHLEERIDGVDQSLDSLRLEMNVGFRALFELGTHRFLDHEGRLRRIETHLKLP